MKTNLKSHNPRASGTLVYKLSGLQVPKKREKQSSGKILELMKSNRGITIPELALEIGVTEGSIERNIHEEMGSLCCL